MDTLYDHIDSIFTIKVLNGELYSDQYVIEKEENTITILRITHHIYSEEMSNFIKVTKTKEQKYLIEATLSSVLKDIVLSTMLSNDFKCEKGLLSNKNILLDTYEEVFRFFTKYEKFFDL